jgi:hypothetical protein
MLNILTLNWNNNVLLRMELIQCQRSISILVYFHAFLDSSHWTILSYFHPTDQSEWRESLNSLHLTREEGRIFDQSICKLCGVHPNITISYLYFIIKHETTVIYLLSSNDKWKRKSYILWILSCGKILWFEFWVADISSMRHQLHFSTIPSDSYPTNIERKTISLQE